MPREKNREWGMADELTEQDVIEISDHVEGIEKTCLRHCFPKFTPPLNIPFVLDGEANVLIAIEQTEDERCQAGPFGDSFYGCPFVDCDGNLFACSLLNCNKEERSDGKDCVIRLYENELRKKGKSWKEGVSYES